MDSVVDAWRVGEDMKGSGHIITEILLRRILGETEENHWNPQPGQRFELGTLRIRVRSVTAPASLLVHRYLPHAIYDLYKEHVSIGCSI
jgi:hypothetical protein